jgi:hypothetical protein
VAYLRNCAVEGVRLTFNGQVVPPKFPRPAFAIRDFGWGRLYQETGRTDLWISVRTNGVEMFRVYSGHEDEVGSLLIELTGPSIDLLTSNRDSFRNYATQATVSELVSTLRTDGRRALQLVELGEEFFEIFDVVPQNKPTRFTPGRQDPGIALKVDGTHLDSDVQAVAAILEKPPSFVASDVPIIGWSHIAIHASGPMTEAKDFLSTPRARKLLAAWTVACREVMKAAGNTLDASGFVFVAGTESECVKRGARASLLLNPLILPGEHIAEELVDRATHEAAHLFTVGQHSEAWAVKEFDLRRAIRGKRVHTLVRRALVSGRVSP